MTIAWPDLLDRLLAGDDLSAADAEAALGAIMDGEVDPSVIGGFLVALRTKPTTTDEMVGLVTAMRNHAVVVDAAGPLLDTCGTGGDRAGTVNISTMAALVCAGAGVRVAKHGNRAASSQCGSADVLEALGVVIDLPPEGVQACLDQAGIAFMFAPAYHPALKYVMPVRRALGIRTVFNVLGPLANPARPQHQVIGVPDPALGVRMAETLAGLGAARVLVVHGHDGLDELSTTGVNKVWELDAGVIREWELEPQGLGLARASLDDLRGGDAARNAAVVGEVLAGAASPVRDIVVLNAAAGLLAVGAVDDLAAGLAAAGESIDSGAAQRALDRFREVSQAVRAST